VVVKYYRKTFLIFGLLIVVLMATGCASPWAAGRMPVRPPQGFVFTSHKGPLTTNFDNTPVGEQIGMGETQYFREFLFTGWDFSWGEADVYNNVQNRLDKPGYIDYEYLNIFYIYQRFTIHVYGQP